MRKLMADDSSQFGIGKALADACSDSHGVSLLVDAAGKGVQHRVVYDVHLGHRHTASHGEVLHDVIHTRILPTLQRSGTSGMTYHGGVEKVGDEEPHAHNAHHPRQHLQHLIIDIIPVDFGVAAIHRVSDAQRIAYHQEHIYDSQQDAWEQEQEQNGLQIVLHLLSVHAHILHLRCKRVSG